MSNVEPSEREPSDSVAARTALFFRTCRTVSVPLYAAMVRELCASPYLPFELAAVFEDIGQAFLRFADEVNAELQRRGVLEDEGEADAVVEARVEQMIERILGEARHLRPRGAGPADEATPEEESLRQALRAALVMVHDLPLAPQR